NRDTEGRQRHAEYGFALARAVNDERLRGALESASVRVLALDRELREKLSSIIDVDGTDAPLRPIVDRHKAMAEAREAVFAARVARDGWDAGRCWDLLGGSTVTSVDQKKLFAGALGRTPESLLTELVDVLRKEMQSLKRTLRDEITLHQLRNAF